MPLVRRGALLESNFEEVQINNLRKSNLIDLPQFLIRMTCESLDSYSKWREVVALADDSRYAVSALDVEKCASVVHRSFNASPTESLLMIWAGRNMTAEMLAGFLNTLRIERPLKYLKLPEELTITVQPESLLFAVEGNALELNCEAIGFPYPVYEWFKEKTQIRTAVSNTGRLIVDSVTANVVGSYICRIHHTNHITTKVDVKFTNWCTVEFQAQRIQPTKHGADSAYGLAPVISQHPVSQTLRQNETLVLSCQAQSSSVLRYHWVKNGSLIAAGNRIQIPLLDVTDAGEYYCIVDSEFGEVRSRSAMISVNTVEVQVPMKPQLLRQPVDLSVGLGGDAVFVVEAEYVTELTYQWHHNNESIPNACGPELRFPVEDSSCEGTYQCLVSSGHRQSVLSKPAKLTITDGSIVYKAADKLALLIGVSSYKCHGVPLPAVKNDFQETVKVLEEMQFKVVSLLDLTLDEMHDAVNMFCNLLSENVYTIFYCAGHGFIAKNGRHYLIPCDARPDVSPAECMCIESVQEQIQQKKPKLMMFCLDVCRRRMPSSDICTQSLDELSAPNSVPNRIILYAASEGQQAFEESKKSSNKPRGLFNQYLLEVIHKSRRAVDLYCALIDKFRTSPYRTSPYHRDSFRQNPEMAINCEDYYRSLHDPLDTKCYRDTINKQTVLWQQVHQLPPNYEMQLGSKIGKFSLTFSRITSNAMRMSVTMDLACGWDSRVRIDNNSVPAALQQPVESRFCKSDKSTSCTFFCLENLQRLREDLQIILLIELICGQSCYQIPVPLPLGRPLIAFAYRDRTPAASRQVLLLPGSQTEHKEAMEHTEDQSLSSV